MLHTFFYRLMDSWRANFVRQSQSRQRAGFDALPSLDELWGERDLFHVNTLLALDGEPVIDWPRVVHGAPVLTSERRAVPAAVPWAADDPAPVVLLSFSTVRDLNPRPLGYEPHDARLCRLGPSLVTALTSVDSRREVVSSLLRISCLSLSRRIPCTNSCTNVVPDRRVSALSIRAARTFRPVGSSFHRRLRRLGI